jgi:acetyl esterase/lipase
MNSRPAADKTGPCPVKRSAAATAAWFLTRTFVVLAALTGTTAQGQEAESGAKAIVKKGIVYGRVGATDLVADIAYPEGKGPFPAVVSVHGGRWRGGSRTDKSTIDVAQWAGFGFVALSIDYRLVGTAPAPACYQDLLCAIRWVHAHAKEQRIDKDRIFLIGQSAGGHLVSLVATLGEGPFKHTGGWEDQPADVRAVISVAGPYELNTLDWGTLWAPAGVEASAARKLASPLHHVSAKTRPLLVIHSDDDHSVPVVQAVNMARALEQAKVRSRFVHYKDKGHMGITPDVIQEALAFIEEIGGKPAGK